MHIGGAGVARGYLNQPELTRERFVADPFSDAPGARMYKTGDLARWRADGTIEFLGRNDHQVKIRGFRIELGEIEARLLAHPQVREAVVLAREDQPGQQQLVAYVVGEATPEQLRHHLVQALPHYMVPAAWVQLPALPLTPNGKVDRQALAPPQLQPERGYEAPQGEVETELARIWAEVLKLERVGRHDNFFELGGHSLAATQVAARMRQAGLHAEMSAFFVAPTLAEFVSETQGAWDVAV
jgi:hypothetical protein